MPSSAAAGAYRLPLLLLFLRPLPPPLLLLSFLSLFWPLTKLKFPSPFLPPLLLLRRRWEKKAWKRQRLQQGLLLELELGQGDRVAQLQLLNEDGFPLSFSLPPAAAEGEEGVPAPEEDAKLR